MFDAEVITKEMIEKAIEKTQKFRELYYTNFLKNYRQRVNEFYFKEYQESPDNFQFMQPISKFNFF